jgi:hypothetical protein
MNDNQFENCFKYLSTKCKFSIVKIENHIYWINADSLFSTVEEMRSYFGYLPYDLRINNFQFKVNFLKKEIKYIITSFENKNDNQRNMPWEDLKLFKSIILEHVYKNMKNDVIENLTKNAIKEMISS